MFSAIDEFSGALFGGNNANVSTGYTLMYNIANAFCTWDVGTAESSGAYSMVEAIYRFVAPLAMTLALCFMVLGILQAISQYGMENITFTIILMPILRYAACAVVIKYGLQMSGYIMSGSNSLVNAIPNIVDTAKGMQNESDQVFAQNLSALQIFGNAIGRFFLELMLSLLTLIFQIGCGLMVAYQIITIRIEFLVRTAFMPLAISDIAQNGVRGSGMKYIKRLLLNMFMLMGILATIVLTFFIINDISVNLNIFEAEWINKIVIGIFITCCGPCCAVGAVTSFKAALNEMF